MSVHATDNTVRQILHRVGKPRDAQTFRDALLVSSANAAEIRRYLESRPVKSNRYIGPQECQDADFLDYLLYRRKDPAIDAALATYGQSIRVLNRLRVRAKYTMRVVLAANPFFYSMSSRISHLNKDRRLHKSNLDEVLLYGSLEELRGLCESPHNSDRDLERIILSWPVLRKESNTAPLFDCPAVEEERFKWILTFLSGNPCFERTEDASTNTEYRPYKSFQSVMAAIWRLPLVAPIDKSWAALLANFFERLRPQRVDKECINLAIARWSDVSLIEQTLRTRTEGNDTLNRWDDVAPLREALKEIASQKHPK